MLQTEDVDKVLQTIEDSLPVYEDIDKAMEDGKFKVLLEGGPIMIKHGGKVLRFVGSIREIGHEIADLDPAEAGEVIDAIAEQYGKGDPEVKEAAKEILVGMAGIRSGIVRIIAIRKAAKEAENTDQEEAKE